MFTSHKMVNTIYSTLLNSLTVLWTFAFWIDPKQMNTQAEELSILWLFSEKEVKLSFINFMIWIRESKILSLMLWPL